MIPKGFLEVHAVQHPPIIGAEALAGGAVVKYLASRLVEAIVPNGESTVTVVHEFQSRAGAGLVFRVAGSPDLNGKLWACRPSWVIWLQFMGAPDALWHVGALLEVRLLTHVMARQESAHRELDHVIAVEAGVLRAGMLRFVEAEDARVRDVVSAR